MLLSGSVGRYCAMHHRIRHLTVSQGMCLPPRKGCFLFSNRCHSHQTVQGCNADSIPLYRALHSGYVFGMMGRIRR